MLASWNDGAAKSALTDFVARIADPAGGQYGGVDFIRAMAEEHYGIPPEQVIGSSAKLRVDSGAGGPVLMKAAEPGSFNDREAKVQNIGLHIGRRPVLAFGNSDGDLAMLRYVKAGPGARLALLLHHDDAGREAAYDRAFKVSPLAEALDQAAAYGIVVVSMKRDWNTVFFYGRPETPPRGPWTPAPATPGRPATRPNF